MEKMENFLMLDEDKKDTLSTEQKMQRLAE
jgi:hypothetical protein